MTHIFSCTGHELKLPRITDSNGVFVFDDQGNKYMDLESGVWCTCLGHKHPRVNKALSDQMERLTHAGFCYSSPIVETAAGEVLDIAGFPGGKTVFLCSGSEAIEILRQMARHLTGKALSMTLSDSYLGSYSSVTDRSRGWFLFNWDGCQTCEKAEACDPSCRALRDVPGNISDFVFEPGSSSGFVRFPPKGLIQNLCGLVRNNGGKIIANEVTTGMGRTGKWFGFQHYPILPDMVAMGKGLGNGYPVSAAALSRQTALELEEKPFKYAQSHQNDPLGAAAAGAVIREIQSRDLIEKAQENGRYLLERLTGLGDNQTIPAVRGRGLMLAVDVKDQETTQQVYEGLIQRGFLLGNRGTALRIDPPLTIGRDDMDRFLAAFETEVGQWS